MCVSTVRVSIRLSYSQTSRSKLSRALHAAGALREEGEQFEFRRGQFNRFIFHAHKMARRSIRDRNEFHGSCFSLAGARRKRF